MCVSCGWWWRGVEGKGTYYKIVCAEGVMILVNYLIFTL